MDNQKINQLRQILREKNLDGFLVSNFFNILYLSGFKTLTENEREAWMLITAKNSYLFSDSRYLLKDPDLHRDDQMIKKLITPGKNLIAYLKEIFSNEKIKAIGIEADDLKVSEFEKIKQEISAVQFIETERLIIKIREIKTETEIKKIKKACQITDLCLDEINKFITLGLSEKEIAFKIEFFLKSKGYDLAFYPIVAVDENSAIIHYDTRSGNNKKIKDGSVVLIDFGVKYEDYLSDVTRMFFVGKKNSEKMNLYQVLKNSQEKVLNYNNGFWLDKKIKEIDLFSRGLINKNNLPIYPHATGHGLGLEIHEYPKISPVEENFFKKNQVITIEPGIYFEGKWGMRIEDTVLINNFIEVLTTFPK